MLGIFLAFSRYVVGSTSTFIAIIIWEQPKMEKDIERKHTPLKETRAAEYLGLAVQTLRNWRHLQRGPVYYKISKGPRGRVVYYLEDLKAYLEKHRIDPEAR